MKILVMKDKLQAVLEAAMKERPKRPDLVKLDGGWTEPAWVQFERESMHKAVNAERSKLGKGPLPLEAVKRVEQFAVGHVDYSSKFSLYCAELVLLDQVREP